MKFWFALIQVTDPNVGYLNTRILVYFSIIVCNFLSLRACTSCYFFKLYFLHVFNLVYNGSEFIFLCSSHCFRHPPNVSSKVGVEFILVVLYIDGLSSFFIFHQTQNISTIIEVLPCSCKHFLCKLFCVSWYLWLHSPMHIYLVTTNIWIPFHDKISCLVMYLWEIPL